MKLFKLCSVIICTLFLFSCNRSGNNNSCTGAICTQVFTYVYVQVLDTTGYAMLNLDDAYTVRQSTGEVIRPHDANVCCGNYPVLDDNYRATLGYGSDVFIFNGIKNGKVIAQAQYTISADCCHITKVSGPTKISVTHY